MVDGKANWDIAKASTDTISAEPADTSATKFAMKLKSLEIKQFIKNNNKIKNI